MKNLLLILFVITCLYSCNNQQYDPNIVGHWKLDGNAKDDSSYKSNGKIFGDPQKVKGILDGQALDFNGNDYIEIDVEGNAPQHIKDLSIGSISIWFKARKWDIDATILPILYYGRKDICPEAFDGTNGGMIIEVGHGGIFPSENIFFTVYDKTCEYPTMCFDSNNGMGLIEPEKWYHFVVSVGENYNTGYLNGKELSNRRYNFQSETTSLFFKDFLAHESMWIGKGYWKDKEVFFDGLIDDIRIYNRPLLLEDVQELYKPKL